MPEARPAMIDARLAGWPLGLSVGLHAVGLATVSSVLALAHHLPERTLVPVEVVRVEPPPPAPPATTMMPAPRGPAPRRPPGTARCRGAWSRTPSGRPARRPRSRIC